MFLKKRYTKLFLLTSLFTLSFFLPCLNAYAVKIIPPRLVIGSDVKVEHMFIKNTSNKREAFRFGWKHIAMDKEGNVLNLDKIGRENGPSEYKAADDLIRFSPRRAILEPGQTQRITFMLRRSSNLPVGEYRSHFLVEREPLTNASETAPTEEDGNSLPSIDEPTTPSVEVDVLVSRAVPIYVLNGETSAKLKIVNASIKTNNDKTNAKAKNIVHFKVQKEGNRSIIGIAHVLCQSSGQETVISSPAKVFAVYAEGEFRNEQIPVQIPAKGCSSYRLAIKGHPDDVLAGEELASHTF